MRAYDAILLLGVELGNGDQPTQELIARADAAAKAWQQAGARIVACGGVTQGHARAEADVMASLLLARGVPAEAILLEDQSRTTMENMRNAAQLLGGAKGRRVLIVTSDYHLRRSVMTARRVGFAARGFAALLPRDAAWKQCARKEWGYTLDLVMGWQDPGKTRPDWANRLFDAVFSRRGK